MPAGKIRIASKTRIAGEIRIAGQIRIRVWLQPYRQRREIDRAFRRCPEPRL